MRILPHFLLALFAFGYSLLVFNCNSPRIPSHRDRVQERHLTDFVQQLNLPEETAELRNPVTQLMRGVPNETEVLAKSLLRSLAESDGNDLLIAEIGLWRGVPASGKAEDCRSTCMISDLHWELPPTRRATSPNSVRWIILIDPRFLKTDEAGVIRVLWAVRIAKRQDAVEWGTTYLRGGLIDLKEEGVVRLADPERILKGEATGASVAMQPGVLPQPEFKALVDVEWPEPETAFATHGFWAPEKRMLQLIGVRSGAKR
jgi:hypothetical protein